MTFQSAFIERFESKFTRGNPDECWEWKGDREVFGYGRLYERISYKRWKAWRAHRVMFMLENKISIGRWDYVCHHCDNPPCVNPKHLFLGTQKDNMEDCKAKGRTRNRPFPSGDLNPRRANPSIVMRGELHPLSTLTEKIVQKIYKERMKGKTAKQISHLLKLKFQTVLGIMEGLSWVHLLGTNGNPTKDQLRNAGPGKSRKLNIEKVRLIRQQLSDGKKRKNICVQFKISPAMLSMIHNELTWPDP